jgi:hypothetical protein
MLKKGMSETSSWLKIALNIYENYLPSELFKVFIPLSKLAIHNK